jgi:type IV pilus assembly protein PilF
MRLALLFAFVTAIAACASNPTPELGKGANLREAARINTQLGVDYMRKGDLNLAEEKLKRAIAEDSSFSLAHSALGILYSRRGRDDDAEHEFREALSLDPSDSDSLNNYGSFLCSQGKIERAEEMFVKAAKNGDYSQPELAWTNAGVCVQNSEPDKAEEYFRDALRANPNYPDALVRFASLCYQKGDYLRARAFLQRYETVALPTPNTLWLRARTEAALGDDTTARLYEERLKTQFPEAQIADPGAKPADSK